MIEETQLAEEQLRHEAKPRYEYLQFHCAITNFLDASLNVKEVDKNMWGKWMQSPGSIPMRDAGGFGAQGRENSASGTAGYVIYQVGDDPNTTLRINWNVPYIGKSSASTETTGNITATQKPDPVPNDNSVSVTVVVKKKG